MSIENQEMAPVKAEQEEDKTSAALLQDVLDDLDPMEEGRRRRRYNPFPGGPIHIDRPKSKVSGTQIVVRDGKITVKGR